MKRTTSKPEVKQAKAAALALLQSPHFFNLFLAAVEKAGLVGERQNALVLFVATVSRLLPRPLNVLVKGPSSTGKNYLVNRVLKFLPKRAVVQISSASDKSWCYAGENYRHCVLLIDERNAATGQTESVRILISEGRVTRQITAREHGQLVTKDYLARGPVAAISTTTKNRIQIDDETRHVSIWVDESREQTRAIVCSYTESRSLSADELRTWRMVHRLLEGRIGIEIAFPGWFHEVAKRLHVNDVRVRRYFPAFVEACRTVCLIRSFRCSRTPTKLTVSFEDFAITTLIFENVFTESLHRRDGREEMTRRAIHSIQHEDGKAVTANDLAVRLGISNDRAYARLRRAAAAGLIRRANRPEPSNRKSFVPCDPPRFIPDPEKLFRKITGLGKRVCFVHPLTGKEVVYRTHEP